VKKIVLSFWLCALTALTACKSKDTVTLQRPEEDGWINVSQTQDADSVLNKKQNVRFHP